MIAKRSNGYLPFPLPLALTLLFGWMPLVYCSMSFCWLLLGVALAVIIARVIACFTSLAPYVDSR